jgi:hypothetical protein
LKTNGVLFGKPPNAFDDHRLDALTSACGNRENEVLIRCSRQLSEKSIGICDTDGADWAVAECLDRDGFEHRTEHVLERPADGGVPLSQVDAKVCRKTP